MSRGRLAALLLGAQCALAAAQPVAWRAPASLAPLRIDGALDEEAWAQAPVHDRFGQFLPVELTDAPAGYRTTLQIVAEEHALVFGLRAWDPRPEEIRAPLMRRDQVKRDQDFVMVLVDAVGSRRAAQFWRVNASGTLADGVFKAEEDAEDFSPDFEVEAAARRLPDGYSVELRVPLLALRYPYEGGRPWRVMAGRSIPRDASVLLLSAPLTKDALSFIAELEEIGGLEETVAAARDHALLSVRPELTLRATRERTGAARTRDQEAALGAEIKWRPRADWVFDATLNPDFSQVELDVPQLAASRRFALVVPEKRPFFLESTDVLDLSPAAYYSRSITDPGWGLRATWRGARADATALTLRDDGGGTQLDPGAFGTGTRVQQRRAQATLLRGRWHAEDATTGLLVSTRDEVDGESNQVLGADWWWRPAENGQLRLRAMASNTSGPVRPADPSTGDMGLPAQRGRHLHAVWALRSPRWNWNAEALDISPGFRHRNGFVERAGVRVLQNELIRRWGEVEVPGPLPFTAYEFENYLWWQQQVTLPDPVNGIPGGQTVGRYWHPGLWWTAARNTEAFVHLRLEAERARADGRLHPLRGLAFSVMSNPAPWLTKLQLDMTLGRLLDAEADRAAPGRTILLEAQWRAGLPNGWGLESEHRVEQTAVERPDGARAFTDGALRWLGVLHVDARDSLRALWQRTRYRRSEEPALGLEGADARTHITSLVFQRRFGVGRSLSAGLTREVEQPGPGQPATRRSELFAKWSFVIDR
ncbi:MAG: hypothetical protein KIT35_14560 [Piscinibacter sp.]|uniref:DUF5916 domain-containing protein n=1 Tax=Piscinibacter TaxID=1114981 RepID=UPI000FDD3BFC|nr:MULTISPECIES: DUF5916 domain-containing protein [Piscinibacter]MCW5665048.1 hypothetical protein [Piscinibacter sp.]